MTFAPRQCIPHPFRPRRRAVAERSRCVGVPPASRQWRPRALLATLALPTLILAACAPAAAADLTIRLCGMENREGSLRVRLFSEARSEGFTEIESEGYAVAVAARIAEFEPAAVVPVTIHALLPGRYAISAYHDENGNGEFDRGSIVGTPQESYGYSTGARARVSAVEFDEAAFDVAGDSTIDVRVAPWKITGGDGSPCPP